MEVKALNVSGDVSQTVRDIAKLSSLGPGSILDTTGYLDKLQGRAIAQEMLKHARDHNPDIEAAVFYKGDDLYEIDHEGRVESYDKKKDERARARLVAFWDVGHTTGSDIPISKSKAVATMIVGKHLRLFELMQSAMRLRQLGSGQRLEIVVKIEDRDVMVSKLESTKKGFGRRIQRDDRGQPILTVNHVIQYAALEELMGEAEHNYRAVDMRLKMGVISGVMDLLWSETVENTVEIFKLVRPLFVKTVALDPWTLVGSPTFDVELETAKTEKGKEAKGDSVRLEIVKNKKRFVEWCRQASVDCTWIDNFSSEVDQIIAELKCEESKRDECMPLHPFVQQSDMLGSRQHVEVETETETHIQIETHIHIQVETHIEIMQEVEEAVTIELLRPHDPKSKQRKLRRDPYPARQVIPVHKDVFSKIAHAPIPLEKLLTLRGDELAKDANGAQELGGAVLATDVFALDKSLFDGMNGPSNPNCALISAAPALNSMV